MTHELADALETATDADLVLRSRSGDGAAFGELWSRHYRSGIVVARSVTTSIDADDLVQEAYARIFQAIRRGGGPTGAFRAYLFASIRNTAAAWGRARSEQAIDELESVEDPGSTDEATTAALDRSLTHTAFRSLPTRWQEVLWYTEIEQLKPAEVAPLLGMKPVAVAQLAFRAREGLREAWIQAHLRAVADGSDCAWTIERLGAHTRGNLTARQRERLDSHLDDCARCVIVAGEAKEVGSRLALVLLPLTIGVSATAAYLASLQRDDAAAIALAAMPSGVVEGAVVAGGGALVSVGGAPSPSGSTGTAWTIGSLVAAAAAAVAVAGVVVASALTPGATPTTAPSAGDDAVPPAAAVEADPALLDVLANAIDDVPVPRQPVLTPTPEPQLDVVAPPGPAPRAALWVAPVAAPAAETPAPVVDEPAAAEPLAAAPADEASAGQADVEDLPADEVPAEQPAAEEPVDEAPADDPAPVEETSDEETSDQKTSDEQVGAGGTADEEAPTGETAEEQPTQEQAEETTDADGPVDSAPCDALPPGQEKQLSIGDTVTLEASAAPGSCVAAAAQLD